MNNKINITLISVIAALFIISGIYTETVSGADKKKTTGKKTELNEKEAKQEEYDEFKMPDYQYGGTQYKSPFKITKKRKSGAAIGIYKPGDEIKQMNYSEISINSLKVTGVFSDSESQYAIISGSGEYYIVKNAKVYNEDDLQIIGLAAVIKKDKLVLITENNTIYELHIPE